MTTESTIRIPARLQVLAATAMLQLLAGGVPDVEVPAPRMIAGRGSSCPPTTPAVWCSKAAGSPRGRPWLIPP